MMKRKVAHFKNSCIAYSPDSLVHCINKYSNNYEAVLFGNIHEKVHFEYEDKIFNKNIFCKKIDYKEFDLIHYHNYYLKGIQTLSLIQYHSPDVYVDNTFSGKKIIISQFQCFMNPYMGWNLDKVRNILDINLEEVMPKRIEGDKILVSFSPSTKLKSVKNEPSSKGYYQTEQILENIKKKFPKSFDYDIIHGVSLKECLERKRKSDIVIDECVTESFHRSGLEGLSMGKMVVCNLSERMEKLLLESSKATINPFENFDLNNLEKELTKILQLENPKEYINKIGKRNRQWMESFWNPINIVKEYELIYEDLLK